MTEHRFRDPQGNEWVTIDTPSDEVLATYPEGTIEIGMLPIDPPNSSPFLPLDPAPFWLGALFLLGMTQDDILNAIPAGIEREAARIAMRDRKKYLRDDPMVIELAAANGIPSAQMDSLWLYVQENYD